MEGKPTIADLVDQLRGRLDRRYGLEPLRSVRWLDGARVDRRTWPDRYGERGCALKKVAAALGIAFRHHDALEERPRGRRDHAPLATKRAWTRRPSSRCPGAMQPTKPPASDAP